MGRELLLLLLLALCATSQLALVDGACTASTCNNHGFCRTEPVRAGDSTDPYPCICHAQYYGANCEYDVDTRDNLSEGGLGGVVIAWLLAIPFMVCMYYVLRNAECGKSLEACCDRMHERAMERDHQAVEMQINAPAPGRDANAAPAVAMAAPARGTAAGGPGAPALDDSDSEADDDQDAEHAKRIDMLMNIAVGKVKTKAEARKIMVRADWELQRALSIVFEE